MKCFVLLDLERFPNWRIVFARGNKSSYNNVVWDSDEIQTLKGEKTDERTYTLRSCSIDVHWRLELGVDWNLWI